MKYENKIKEILSHYPKDKKESAIMPILTMFNEEEGYISKSKIEYTANLLNLPIIRVYEIITFYSMYNLEKKAKYEFKVCNTLPCYLKGSENILKILSEILKLNIGESNAQFSLKKTECLGACVNAPVVQFNKKYLENVDKIKLEELIKKIKKWK